MRRRRRRRTKRVGFISRGDRSGGGEGRRPARDDDCGRPETEYDTNHPLAVAARSAERRKPRRRHAPRRRRRRRPDPVGSPRGRPDTFARYTQTPTPRAMAHATGGRRQRAGDLRGASAERTRRGARVEGAPRRRRARPTEATPGPSLRRGDGTEAPPQPRVFRVAHGVTRGVDVPGR